MWPLLLRAACGYFDEVGVAIPFARWQRRWRCAGHDASSPSCDWVTAECVTTHLLAIDVLVVARVLVIPACELSWMCVPLAGVGLVVVQG
jgi:hypothetical protein